MLIPIAVLKNIHVACDPLSSRFVLGGVLFERDGSKIHAVSTDGRRMLIMSWEDYDSDFNFPANNDCKVFIPLQTIKELSKLKLCKTPRNNKGIAKFNRFNCIAISEENTDSFQVRYLSTDAAFQVLTYRQLEGLFPRWRDVIPSHEYNYKNICLDGSYLAELCDSMNNATTDPSDNNTGVIVSFPSNPDNAALLTRQFNGIETCSIIMPKANDNLQPACLPVGDPSSYRSYDPTDDDIAELRRKIRMLESENKIQEQWINENRHYAELGISQGNNEHSALIESLRKELQAVKDENCKLKLENKVLEDTIDTMQTDDRRELENKIVDLENEIIDNTKEIERLEKEVADSNNYYDKLVVEHEQQIELLNAQLKDAENLAIDFERESFRNHSVEEFRLSEQLRVKTALLESCRENLDREKHRNTVLNNSLRALRMEMNELADTVNA